MVAPSAAVERVFDSLEDVAGLRTGVTTRRGGVSRGGWSSLNLGLATEDDPACVAENRRRAAEALGFAALATARQVHGTRVVEARSSGERLGEADAIATDVPGVLVGALGADCPGVLLVDPERRALAVVHAGWRGVAAGVVAAAVRFLAERYGSRPPALRAAVGPGVSASRYEVGPEVVAALGADVARPSRGDRSLLDLPAAVRRALVAAGVPAVSIEDCGRCTVSEPEAWFSHRRDGAGTGRHALVAGWLPGR